MNNQRFHNEWDFGIVRYQQELIDLVFEFQQSNEHALASLVILLFKVNNEGWYQTLSD